MAKTWQIIGPGDEVLGEVQTAKLAPTDLSVRRIWPTAIAIRHVTSRGEVKYSRYLPPAAQAIKAGE